MSGKVVKIDVKKKITDLFSETNVCLILSISYVLSIISNFNKLNILLKLSKKWQPSVKHL